jgi:hypothetical protein
MKEEGFSTNTSGEDLDKNQLVFSSEKQDVVTAFEIFEHLLNPYTILSEIKSDKIFISIPLRLWSAYRSKTDMWDRHYHEFEDWQLDWLLEKTGWKIIDSQKWTNPLKNLVSAHYCVILPIDITSCMLKELKSKFYNK